MEKNSLVFSKIKAVSIFGFANTQPGEKLYKDTVEVAMAVATAGATIVNGGGPGAMRAATEGAHAVGGRAVIATFYPKFMENFEGKDPKNKADKEIVMSNYLDRTLKLLELGNAYIVMNGGTGTFSEFGMAWGLAKLYLGHHKPLILYGAFWHEIVESLAKNMLIRPEAMRVYRIATTPDAVVKELIEYEKSIGDEVHGHMLDDDQMEGAFVN
jgi:uncharacterized protein (TIGR00730 family)